jgi:hypothetical protein
MIGASRIVRLLAAAMLVALPFGLRAQVANPHGARVGECSSCHSPDRWTPARMSKNYQHAPGRFPLYGAHAAAPCASCHVALDFSGTRPTCVSCHRDPHQGQLGPACSNCHTPRSFIDRSAMLQAHQLTRFPLVGAHRTVDCESCHAPTAQGQQRYAGRSTDCVSCHRADLAATKNPDHNAAGFPVQCGTCHGSTFWARATFDHSRSGFPLTGTHALVTCSGCHSDNVFRNKPTSCAACHMTAFTAAKNPDHVRATFPTTCETCHNTTTWSGSTFDHAKTQFPLVGAHVSASCESCHSDGVYSGKPTTCVSCHLAEYNGTSDPKHSTAGFSKDCASCHGSTSWNDASFNHASTAFPLTGAHKTTSCAGCHGDGVYAGKPTTCVSCHLTNYNRTSDPKHSTAGFSKDCASCHGTASWSDASFDHSKTSFPLTGAHKTTSCAGCHSDGVYAGKPTTCVSCHLTSYNTTTDPKHSTAHFPTTCQSCHTTTRWTGATFDHDAQWFPIYSGTHRGRWSTCSSCHANNSNYASFTCLTCHSQSESNSQHSGVSGYRYNSGACYSCHPKGRSD